MSRHRLTLGALANPHRRTVTDTYRRVFPHWVPPDRFGRRPGRHRKPERVRMVLRGDR